MNLWQFLRVKIIGWWTWRRRQEALLCDLAKQVETGADLLLRTNDTLRAMCVTDGGLLARIERLEGLPYVNMTNVYEIIEDLKARMPAVSDHRMNQEILKLLLRIEKLEGRVSNTVIGATPGWGER